ncbi:CDP-alcohol phosphatidyltransferase family protein [Actinomycetospora termitidis]|uniref:CDP-alcohol phosphatidyltransferase family protein n=1 Tax=Actinomycetospora termitidis TaxID=3053470 RepID=A0ABT7M820_9PSEU|nr:CDP-alcohol phosphatidyltransferase family protein [Actinomycetospora sp. Odt1-22]MDL5156596.1 CDP-alcohol phosphatidyltransferase family protein [Actinomycetospora sp. Odt1-22]
MAAGEPTLPERGSTLLAPPIAAQLTTAGLLGAALLAALHTTSGLGGVGLMGGALVLVLGGALLARSGERSLGPAGSVTLLRLVLIAGVAGLVVQHLAGRPVRDVVLVGLTVAALALDAVDGWVARRTGTCTERGARFDMESDAFLLLLLAVYVASDLGPWVLLVGGMRYLFVAAGWVWPWLTAPLPARYSAKVVAALQGVALVVASAHVLPGWAAAALVGAALVALVWSFGVSVQWLARHADPGAAQRTTPVVGTEFSWWRGLLTGLAALVLVAVLVAPRDPSALVWGSYLRLPLEGVAGLALLVLLPDRWRRLLAVVVGVLLGVGAVLTAFDVGFVSVLARPFDPVLDSPLLEDGVGFVGSTYGSAAEVAAIVAAIVLGVLLVAGAGMAARRVAGAAARHRRGTLRVLAALGGVWLVGAVAGLQTVPGVPVAAATTAAATVDRAAAMRTAFADAQRFRAESGSDAWADAPAADLLGGLRGKDVVVAIVESYGRSALDDPGLAATVAPAVDAGQARLAGAGYGARSGFLTSSVVGSGSWLAHATLLSGLRVDNQQRYYTLTSSDRFTLSAAFARAGWETAAVQPGTTRAWPEGRFYGYQRAYNVHDLGYRGPSFGWASMPDQVVLDRVSRLELDRPARGPVMAEVDLVSSHAPWTPLPHMVDWDTLGDGSQFAAQAAPTDAAARSTEQVRQDYAHSVAYTMDALTSWVQRSADPNLVVVVVGDHQPAPLVTGPGAGKDVPISILSRDPAVLDRVGSWGWSPGLRPTPDAPTWPMEAFRDRFLGAYSGPPRL